MKSPEEFNADVQAICKIAKERSTNPTQGMRMIYAAAYAFWRVWRDQDSTFEDWLDSFEKDLRELHQMNETKGNA